ncbi:MAG: TetR family transcriptional regulator C-terminal domain-containing protein [Phycisphaerales bacterium]|nr:TetR family transcriptional regulator C-terminal domain-containing protein [Phycisphaerales bacterium]
MTSTTANTKDRIIDAGSAAIAAKSFNGCGLKEILDTAGVPKGSFYHYFKCKEDLGVAVIEESAAAHSEFIRELLSNRQLSPLKRVQHMFSAMRDHYIESGPLRECVIAKLALEVAQLSEPMRLAIKFAYTNWSAQIARALTEAKAAGEISESQDPQELADFLVNAWEGCTLRMQIDQNTVALDQFMERITKTLPKV